LAHCSSAESLAPSAHVLGLIFPSWGNQQVEQEGAASQFLFLLRFQFWNRTRLGDTESRGCIKSGNWCSAAPTTEACIVGKLRSTKCATPPSRSPSRISALLSPLSHEPVSHYKKKSDGCRLLQPHSPFSHELTRLHKPVIVKASSTCSSRRCVVAKP
jgi:hypothetical protein